ncbi:hypothetical protein OJ253_2267 [Cryptosporidium canis]|uniref:Uncharacterized protein n=1 Tax=Cryptosporidium canis TaxID=195482 RepID=A0A9D5HWV1_9CRYT|nr:hypothetical protein OJ253_2267 [Cryptosporidium canis]
MNTGAETLGNMENAHQPVLNPTITLDRKHIFSNDKHNLWELFSERFLSFTLYPLKNDTPEEIKSVHEVMKIFENWRSLLSTKKMSLVDFCKVIEKLSFHIEAQDYRLKAIYKYKSIKKNMISNQSSTELRPNPNYSVQRNYKLDSKTTDLGHNENQQSLESSYGIIEMLNTKRELALKKRKLLLTERA